MEWAEMWSKIKRFNRNEGRPEALAREPVPGNLVVPRASMLNVVHHADYTRLDAAAVAAGERMVPATIWRTLKGEGGPEGRRTPHLFWIVVDHYEGEFRVGLGHISQLKSELDASPGQEADCAATDLELAWFTRKNSTRDDWGKCPTFSEHKVQENGRMKRSMGLCKFTEVIPLKISFTEGSTAQNPRPTTLSITALRSYCASDTTHRAHIGDKPLLNPKLIAAAASAGASSSRGEDGGSDDAEEEMAVEAEVTDILDSDSADERHRDRRLRST